MLASFQDRGGHRKVARNLTSAENTTVLDQSPATGSHKFVAFNLVETAGTAGYVTFYHGYSDADELDENIIRRVRVAANGENTDSVIPELGGQANAYKVPRGVRVVVSAGTMDLVLFYVHGSDGAEEVLL